LHLIIVVEVFSPQRDVSLGEGTSGNRWARGPDCTADVNFRWTFTFCVEKSYGVTHLAFGRTLDRRYHFKHASIKAGSTTVKRARLTGKGDESRRQCCHNKHKEFPYVLHVMMYLYFPDAPRIWFQDAIVLHTSAFCNDK
jgi:hypothetical protein